MLNITAMLISVAASGLSLVGEDNAVSKTNLKSFNLNVKDQAILNESLEPDCCYDNEFEIEASPSAGEENIVEQMKVKPEFRYYRPDDYNSKLNIYDTEVKMNVTVPVDINFE